MSTAENTFDCVLISLRKYEKVPRAINDPFLFSFFYLSCNCFRVRASEFGRCPIFRFYRSLLFRGAVRRTKQTGTPQPHTLWISLVAISIMLHLDNRDRSQDILAIRCAPHPHHDIITAIIIIITRSDIFIVEIDRLRREERENEIDEKRREHNE